MSDRKKEGPEENSPKISGEKRFIGDFTLGELREQMMSLGHPAYRGNQIFSWVYQKGITDFALCTDLPFSLRQILASRYLVRPLELDSCLESRDRTQKFLFRLRDGYYIETVLIPSARRHTICVSTQVGCKFRCAFCASGLRGFFRDLSAAEITGQVLFLKHELDLPLTNIVFMGMGEPLDNFEEVSRAIQIMNSPEGMGIAARRMTVSTCGIVPGIRRLKELALQVNLSLSLHAAREEIRRRLLPVARKYSLEEILDACAEYVEATGRILTLEYVLLAGENDSQADATSLSRIAAKLKAKVNLIPYSPVPGLSFQSPEPEKMAIFAGWLRERGIKATVRRSKGLDIQAACGQLAGRLLSRT